MKLTYKHTVLACYVAYISSATVNNLASLLFIFFQDDFGLSITQLASLVTANFVTQIIVDLIGAKYADTLGYRTISIISNSFMFIGLICLGVLPMLMSSTFAALFIAAIVYAIGSGLGEVIISPIIEALPGEQKESAMSILHSFYCWGHVGMILLSTAYLVFVPLRWNLLPILWAVVPMCALLLFIFVPIRTLNADKETPSMSILALFKTKVFWVFILLMIFGGASEQIMAQWSSLFAESELGVSKLVGNLLGPCFFALMMAITRTFYGKFAEKLPLVKALIICSFITITGYLIASLTPIPYIALFGCGLVGVGVALYWPGVLSVSAKALPSGGASMFAILALFGDLGCSLGPQLTAVVSEAFENNLKIGLLSSIGFPVLITIISFLYLRKRKAKLKTDNL